MTATSAPGAVPGRRTAGLAPLGLARLLRVELRRNAMPLVLPLIAVLFWFDSYRIAATLPPLWNLRTFYILGQGHSLIDFAPFVAGVAAWMGSRDGRRGLTDLVDRHRPAALGYPARHLGRRPRSGRWAAYLVFMAVTFWALSRPHRLGRPAVVAGRGGRRGGGRVQPPPGSRPGRTSRPGSPRRWPRSADCWPAGCRRRSASPSYGGWGLILPTNSNGNYGQDAGIFYQFLPDLPIARVMFLAGVTVALVALLGVRVTAGEPAVAAHRRGDRRGRGGARRHRDRAGLHRPGDGLRHRASQRCTTRPTTGRSRIPRPAVRRPGSRSACTPAYRPLPGRRDRRAAAGPRPRLTGPARRAGPRQPGGHGVL